MALGRMLEREKPDLIWWSGDYLPWSMAVWNACHRMTARLPRIHLSMFDPPEFWGQSPSMRETYQRAVCDADSCDAIGENLKTRMITEGARRCEVLCDYIDFDQADRDNLASEQTARPSFRVAITGQIYSRRDLMKLCEALQTVPGPSEVHWFGNDQNYIIARKLDWPKQVKLIERGMVDRDGISSAISSMDCGFLSMPLDRHEFAKYSVPTKLATYLGAALPIVFIAPMDSELNSMNGLFGFGQNLMCVATLSTFSKERARMQQGGARLAEVRFSRNRVEAVVRKVLENAVAATK
jgi:hypothetical protein